MCFLIPILIGSHHQVSLFAELFNEMLQRDFGYRIYKALASLPAKDEKKDKDKEKKAKKEVTVTVLAGATATATSAATAVVVVGEKKEGGLKRDIKKEKEEESEEPAGKKTREDEEKKKVSASCGWGDSGVSTDLHLVNK